jgi:hypothetical protein
MWREEGKRRFFCDHRRESCRLAICFDCRAEQSKRFHRERKQRQMEDQGLMSGEWKPAVVAAARRHPPRSGRRAQAKVTACLGFPESLFVNLRTS